MYFIIIMILEKFIKTHKALLEIRLLRPFLAKPYGLELALILLEFQKKIRKHL